MNLTKSAELLARLNIGPREGIALGVIHQHNGSAQAHHIKEALGEFSKDPMAVVAILKNKGLAEAVKNPHGYPFWRLTPHGVKAVAESLTACTR